MRKLLFITAMAALLALDWSAARAAASTKKKESSHKTVPAKTTSAKKAPAKSAAARKGKRSAPKTTWRNRQMAPSPERYKEIQDALVAKGYLQPGSATGSWGGDSVDALKRFQADQKIDASGKINSLSLIALGLGPKHDSAATVKPPAAPNPQPDQPGSSR
jgi:hypothetical protein